MFEVKSKTFLSQLSVPSRPGSKLLLSSKERFSSFIYFYKEVSRECCEGKQPLYLKAPFAKLPESRCPGFGPATLKSFQVFHGHEQPNGC